VQIDTQPERLFGEAETLASADNGVQLVEESLICDPNWLSLHIAWYAPERPTRDLSVFVHLLEEDGTHLIFQADEAAPVYGWRPMTTWISGEVVRDVYPIPRWAIYYWNERIRYGLYEQLPSGEFRNLIERELPLECNP
jgi:hypothetical protein